MWTFFIQKCQFKSQVSTSIQFNHNHEWTKRLKVNAVAFRYSTEGSSDPTDVAILDLQNTRLGRAGVELAYFFCSSTSPQQRKSHFEDLLKLYYDCFYTELNNLGDNSEPFFTFDDLKEEYNDCFSYGFILGCMHAQVEISNR